MQLWPMAGRFERAIDLDVLWRNGLPMRVVQVRERRLFPWSDSAATRYAPGQLAAHRRLAIVSDVEYDRALFAWLKQGGAVRRLSATDGDASGTIGSLVPGETLLITNVRPSDWEAIDSVLNRKWDELEGVSVIVLSTEMDIVRRMGAPNTEHWTVMQLGALSSADIAVLWDGPDGERVASACLEWTGGHPVLVPQFLHQVATVGVGWVAADVGNFLVDHPSPRMRSLPDRLKRVAKDSVALITVIQALGCGMSSPELRIDMDELVLSGWLYPSPKGAASGWWFPVAFQEWNKAVFREIQDYQLEHED